MTSYRSVFAAIVVCSVLVTLPSVASATTPSRAALELSTAGKRALSASSLAVASVPKGPTKSPTFAIGPWSVAGSAKIAFTGSLRFQTSRRSLSATKLQLTIGRTSSYVTARLGSANLRLFTVTPTRPAVLDAAQQRASLVGARFALTPAAAKRLKSSLKLKRSPSTAALGKLTVAVAPISMAPTVVPTPAPVATATPTPAPTAAPTATPAPTPDTPCADRFAATPVGSVDWFSCDLPGSRDLHSWTEYVQYPFPAFPCPGTTGTIVASGGATRIVADTAYDHRFSIVSTVVHNDGSITVVVAGTITYLMPVHGIDESIGSFRIEIAAGGTSGEVFADGRAKPRAMGAEICTTPAETYTNEKVLTLDLTGITPVTKDGVKRWVHIPAKIAAGTERLGGGDYEAGRAWGSFTIAVPG